MKLDDEYWSNRYNEKTSFWDTGAITNPLKNYIDQLTSKNIAILIPGCGNSYEAEYLLEKGFTNITLIDLSTSLCNALTKKFSQISASAIKIICSDFFEHQGKYDLIIEQTFFCALDVSLRPDYAIKINELLNENGKLVGLLFNKQFDSNPPFGGDKTAYQRLFEPLFIIDIMKDCYNSHPKRMGHELFIKLRKR